MWCPYCGYEMRRGYVRLRGQWAVGWWAGVLAVNFEADDDSGEGSELLPRTWFRSQDRAAYCCVRCEAVLVEPKSVEYTPPADGSAAAAVVGRSGGRRRRSAVSMPEPEPEPAPAPGPVAGEPGVEVAADASGASGASGGTDAEGSAGGNGNGNGNGAGHGADG